LKEKYDSIMTAFPDTTGEAADNIAAFLNLVG